MPINGGTIMEAYLVSVKKRFENYKTLAEKTFEQVDDEGLLWQYNAASNSIAIIVQHLAGNMLSRWTDFLNSDGEKPWRNRDAEFEPVINTRAELLEKWDQGWKSLADALDSIKAGDWDKKIYIRGEEHSVVDTINRQLAHISYHVGQIVYIGKMVSGEKWHSLSIPKGASQSFNKEKFEKHQKQ
jgi:Protein of unknown function (DUF1572)